MKQILLTLSLFLSLSINAQIQRTFYGLELGKANKQQVEEKMKELGKQITTKKDEIKVHNLKLGDYNWKDIQFGFIDDKLVAVVFTSRNYQLSEKSKAEIEGDFIKTMLTYKYEDYKLMEDKSGIVFFDKSTMVLYGMVNKNQTKSFMLFYGDGIKMMDMFTKMQSDL